MNDSAIFIEAILCLDLINKNLNNSYLNEEMKNSLIFQKVKITNYLKRCFDTTQEDYEVSLYFLREQVEFAEKNLLKFGINVNFNKEKDLLYADLLIIIIDLSNEHALSLNEEELSLINSTYERVINDIRDEAKVFLIYRSLDMLNFFDDEVYLSNNNEHKFYYIVN